MTYLPLEIDTDPMESEAGEVFVRGSVGDRAYRFLLDTGAAITRLVADDYISSFAAVDHALSSGVFAASSDELITVPSIKMGPLSRTSVTVARAPRGGRVTTSLIGMDVLRDVRLHFDFGRSRLGIDPLAEVAAGATFHDLSLDSRSHPYVTVGLGGATAACVWDSGASLTVVDSEFLERHPQHFRAAGQSTGTDSTGSEITTSMYVMSEAAIGGVPFPPSRVAAVDLSAVNAGIEWRMDVVLGYSTLRHADWLLDFPSRRWALLKD